MNIIKIVWETIKLNKKIKKHKIYLRSDIEFLLYNNEVLCNQCVTEFNDNLTKILHLIEASGLETDGKYWFRDGFIGRTYQLVRKRFPNLSGNEIMELFGWEQSFYNEMVRALITSGNLV